MKKLLLIAGGSLLLVLAILFGGLVAAPLLASAHTSSSNTTTSTSATTATNPYCQQYLQDLAQRLGVSVNTLQSDRLAATQDVLNQMVKDGKLTQKEANAIIQRLQSHQACTGKHDLYSGTKVVLAQLKQYLPTIENQVASGLHLTSSQLQADLQKGMTLEQIAKAQNITTAQLHTIVLNAIQSAVNQAVSDGNITQQQGSAFMSYLQSHPGLINHLLNRHFAKATK
ncbi:MAG TPA: hypothetical protein VFA41_02100 [Ktedonobacteraceae bacterium]|jgi:polyhydroxyalkanoate synthesis regulator phasin|nr:hypothetical protein [Ktedonobacteraceae bacterium]